MQLDDSSSHHYLEDIDSLNHVEESFYHTGYEEGFAHGALHGTFEGRALGKEKAFELWEEVGYYEGVASFWKECFEAQGSSSRVVTNVQQLLSLVALFPTSNASSSSTEAQSSDAGPSTSAAEVDLSALVERIRARYKLTCSSLGIRPRMVAASSIPGRSLVDEEGTDEDQAMDEDDAGENDVDAPPATGRTKKGRPLRKGQVMVNGQEISSKSLLF